MTSGTSLAGRRVLITGGAGFIGSNLAHHIVGQNGHVTLIDSFVPEYGGNIHNLDGIVDRVKLNISDVRDPFSMKHLVKGADFVFNLAGQTSHLDSMRDPFTDLEINARAQLYILEALRKHNPAAKVVFASTRQVYGRPDYLPVDESHPIRPVDVNGINKVAGEEFHILYNNVYGIRTCALRLTNTYGPRMRIVDARQTFVGIWIRRLLEGMPIEVWGGQQLRDFNYVDDVTSAFIAAALDDRSTGKVFNLGSQETVSLAELAALLIDINGGGEFLVMEFPQERRIIDIGDYYSDFTVIRETLGWAPKVSLRDGMEQTIAYFRMHAGHYLDSAD